MKGTLKDVTRDDLVPLSADILCEAGLRTRLGNEPAHLGCVDCVCKAIDATECIAVIENIFEVTFSQTDHDRLFALMKRRHIRVDEFAKWLGGCAFDHRQRKPKTHEMPLFKEVVSK